MVSQIRYSDHRGKKRVRTSVLARFFVYYLPITKIPSKMKSK
jgi:hypothetical protein